MNLGFLEATGLAPLPAWSSFSCLLEDCHD